MEDDNAINTKDSHQMTNLPPETPQKGLAPKPIPLPTTLMAEEPAPIPVPIPKEPEPETVTVRKSELDGILSRLTELEQGRKDRTSGLYDGKWQVVKKDDQTKTATLRVKDGNYAMDLWHIRTEWNEKTREKDVIYKIKWLTPDDKYEETEMKLVDFVSNVPRQEVKLIKEDIKKLRRKVGRTRRVEVDYANYRSSPKEEVDMVIERDEITYTVLLPDKREIRLKEDKLNM